MKTEELLIVTKNGVEKLTPTLKYFIDDLKKGLEIAPVYSRGSSWRFSTLYDYRKEIKSTLNSMDLKYEEYNVAPRKGRTGWRIKLIKEIL